MVATEFMAASGRPVDPKQVYGSNPHLVAKDVADAILYVLEVPPHVQVCLSSTSTSNMSTSVIFWSVECLQIV
jgi:NADP-dependent 3-hydroxy acid dehydrogenase YdfG